MAEQTVEEFTLEVDGFGPVEIKRFHCQQPNDRDSLGTTVRVLALHGRSPSTVECWHELATLVVERCEGNMSCEVLCINLHSNLRTSPGNINESGGGSLFLENALKALKWETAVLMGKSWGGAEVVKFAAANPLAVQKLVLSAPATRDQEVIERLSSHQLPTCICWCQDDPVVDFSLSELYAVHPKCNVHAYSAGGHDITSGFLDEAVEFILEQHHP